MNNLFDEIMSAYMLVWFSVYFEHSDELNVKMRVTSLRCIYGA